MGGAVAECGVWTGGTAQLLAEVIGRGEGDSALHLFDTFEGMPATVDSRRDYHSPGDFSDTSVDFVKNRLRTYPYVDIHKGVIPATFSEVDPSMAFSLVHIDVDIYEPTLASCEWFWPRLKPCGVMVFDDYGFFPYRRAERAAVDEFFATRATNPSRSRRDRRSLSSHRPSRELAAEAGAGCDGRKGRVVVMTHQTPEFNVLISSAGRRVALLRAFRKALADLGLPGRVIATDMSAMSAAFQEADAGFLVPPCDDEGFIPTLLQVCAREHVGLVVPTIDTELQVLADQRERFRSQGTIVAISAPEVVKIGSDKGLTHAFLIEVGIPTVAQASVTEVLAQRDDWICPLIVKPRRGSAGIGVRRVDDWAQLERVASTDDFVVQSIAPGVEYTVDFLVDSSGAMVCAVPRRRFEVRAGEVSKGMTAGTRGSSRSSSTSLDPSLARSESLNAQMFLDEDSGQVRVIELNPRFGGGFPLALGGRSAIPGMADRRRD